MKKTQVLQKVDTKESNLYLTMLLTRQKYFSFRIVIE